MKKPVLTSIGDFLAAPFRAGYRAVNERPSGSSYRKVGSLLFATPGDIPHTFSLVIGHNRVERQPVIQTFAARTPEEAANAVLTYMRNLKRTDIKSILTLDRQITRQLAAEARERKRQEKRCGGPESPDSVLILAGNTVPQS